MKNYIKCVCLFSLYVSSKLVGLLSLHKYSHHIIIIYNKDLVQKMISIFHFSVPILLKLHTAEKIRYVVVHELIHFIKKFLGFKSIQEIIQ